MNKTALSLICAAVLATSCGQADRQSFYVDELVLDTEHCIAEGSYVQGVALAQDCVVTLHYQNASGGTAEFSAPESNGMRIDAQSLPMAKGEDPSTSKSAERPSNSR